VSDTAIEALLLRAWEGNARQLKHAVEAACDVCSDSVVEVRDLPGPRGAAPAAEHHITYREARKAHDLEFLRVFLMNALDRNGWNIKAAADEAGIARGTFHQLMKKAGLTRPKRTPRTGGQAR
jgi:transcriptional regulator of acetoin/glycerol metabolism